MKKSEIMTPCYLVSEAALRKNLEILQGVMERTGAKILLAQKAFSMYAVYPQIAKYLAGAAASGLYEARLCSEEMPGKENHVFSPAYQEKDFDEILKYSDHIVFNSWSQVRKFGARAKTAGKQIGLRINPEFSTQEEHEIYDPCAVGSRLGVTLENFKKGLEQPDGKQLYELLDGLHFHTLCEQNADDLSTTLAEVKQKFGAFLKDMKWLNFGGGHHITRADYDIELLETCIREVQQEFEVEVYLEPGEAVALDAGWLHTTVLEIMHNGLDIAILDTSAACHMPDVLEMPYRPPLINSGEENEKAYTYRLTGPTCLAGDVIGDYSFDKPLTEGETLVFGDMAIYSMVKNNTFNGMPLPAIYIEKENGECELVKAFSYEDFKMRLS